MKKNKIQFNVSIAISALNEEGSIGEVIDSILNQKQIGWNLKEIFIYSDGSTDRTVEICRGKSLARPIRVFDYRKRKGKPHRLNQAIERFKGDILIVFDADISISTDNLVRYIVREFKKDKTVGMVGGNSRIYPPKGFLEKSFATTYAVYYKSRDELRGGNNVFACSGACIALKRKFAKSIRIPHGVINEDTFFYFSCLKSGYKFRYVKKALVYFRMASNLHDFIKQMFRSSPEAVTVGYKKYFGDLIEREYFRPKSFYIKAILSTLFDNPLGTLFMICIKLSCKPFYSKFSKDYKLSWFTAPSTKKQLILYSNKIL